MAATLWALELVRQTVIPCSGRARGWQLVGPGKPLCPVPTLPTPRLFRRRRQRSSSSGSSSPRGKISFPLLVCESVCACMCVDVHVYLCVRTAIFPSLDCKRLFSIPPTPKAAMAPDGSVEEVCLLYISVLRTLSHQSLPFCNGTRASGCSTKGAGHGLFFRPRRVPNAGQRVQRDG